MAAVRIAEKRPHGRRDVGKFLPKGRWDSESEVVMQAKTHTLAELKVSKAPLIYCNRND